MCHTSFYTVTLPPYGIQRVFFLLFFFFLHMTIYTAVRMKDGVHYIAPNITQCTKQLKAMKCTDFCEPTNYILIRKNGSIAICNFLNLDADVKRAKSDNGGVSASRRRRRLTSTCRFQTVPRASRHLMHIYGFPLYFLFHVSKTFLWPRSLLLLHLSVFMQVLRVLLFFFLNPSSVS